MEATNRASIRRIGDPPESVEHRGTASQKREYAYRKRFMPYEVEKVVVLIERWVHHRYTELKTCGRDTQVIEQMV